MANPNSEYLVKWAAWGNVVPGYTQYTVLDCTAQIQSILDSGETKVTFGGGYPPDPLPGIRKGWAILINIGGKDYYYAGTDLETVDFTVLPVNSIGRSELSVSGVNAVLVSGGWPTSAQNYLFSSCQFAITNNTGTVYPQGATTSPWVSIDCYFSTSNTPDRSQLIHIGDVPYNVGTMQASHVNQVNLSDLPNGLFNMARFYTSNPNLLPTGTYYLFIEVRTSAGKLLNKNGCSPGIFSPTPPQT